METIQCYGDSNTLGYDPRGFFGGFYDRPWPLILGELLSCRVENLGRNGRCFPREPAEFPKIGQDDSLLIVMLGTNDVLEGRDPLPGLERLLEFLGQTDTLVLSPPGTELPEFREAMAALPRQYETIAGNHHVRFCDTQAWDLPLAYDGVHLTGAAHERFARNLAQTLRPLIRRNQI